MDFIPEKKFYVTAKNVLLHLPNYEFLFTMFVIMIYFHCVKLLFKYIVVVVVIIINIINNITQGFLQITKCYILPEFTNF